jgi:hypothetical protein
MLTSTMEPYMRRIDDHYEVYGLGMIFSHRQLWQAQIKLHYLTIAAGSSTESDWRDDRGRKNPDE